ncbi:MAG: hypothetical protein NBV77_03305 [Bacteroidia bacterium]|nr:hypothetical protein [Bacteroidia bacterium]
MEFDPRIERYFDFELSDSEREEFLRELELNSELKTQFDLYSLIIEGIRSEGREELKEYIKSRVDEQSTTTQTNLWFYAAASVTVLLLGYFAIYKYVETGSLKESADYITLKDEKSDRVKFWKNKKLGKGILPEILFGDNNDSTKTENNWTDSLLAVYQEPTSTDEAQVEDDVYTATSETVDKDDKTTIEKSEEGTYEKNSRMSISEGESAAPVMAKTSTARDKSKKISTDTIELYRRTISTSRVVAIHLLGMQESKVRSEESISTSAPTLASKPNSAKSSPARFTIIQQEARNEKPAIECQGNNIFLINMGSESPLMYEIDGNYYLELGPKNIISIKLNVARLEKPKPITDKKIIDKIQPK